MTIFLAIFSGLGLGYILERGDFCFHSTIRGIFRRPRQLDLLKAYVLTLLLAVPLVQTMIAFNWINPWTPPFSWSANIVGGTIFGIGMVVAATCVTGLFYKMGHGMLGTLVGLAAWALGDILVYQGPLAPMREWFFKNPMLASGNNPTLINTLGDWGWILVGLLVVLGAAWLWGSIKSGWNKRGKSWGWLPIGTAVGFFTSFAWLAAVAGGVDYPFGTSYVPTEIFLAVFKNGQVSSWIPVALVSIIPGAFVAAVKAKTLWVRGETKKRYIQLGLGGFLMGIGAAFAGGCNLGHSLIGVPLLSLGSIVTTLSMTAGVFAAHYIARILKTNPQLNEHSKT